MKIMKIFGIVVGIHFFVLIVIFANPGCTSRAKQPPAPEDTVATAQAAPTFNMPGVTPTPIATGDLPPVGAPAVTVPPTFNPDAPATYAGTSVRFTPTRPNTPAATVVSTQPVENITPVTTHVVKPGDNLWNLAKRYHVTVKDIATANNIPVSAPLRDGKKLIIPAKPLAASAAPASSAPAASAPAAPSPERAPAASGADEVTVTVQPGDTLGAIAKRHGVTTRELGARNHITDPLKLRPGTVLTIPGGKSAAKAGARRPTDDATGTGPAAPAPSQTPRVLDIEQGTPAPQSPGNVPVIKIDDNP